MILCIMTTHLLCMFVCADTSGFLVSDPNGPLTVRSSLELVDIVVNIPFNLLLCLTVKWKFSVL